MAETAELLLENYYGIMKEGLDNAVVLYGKYPDDSDWATVTKAIQIENVGCIVQVSTRLGKHIAEAVTFVPGVKIAGDENYYLTAIDG